MLTPGAFAPMRDNVDGVYGFPALPSGQYNAAAAAPGYQNASVPVQVASGGITSVTVALKTGSITPPRKQCGCGGSGAKALDPGDVFLNGLVLAVMLMISRRGFPGAGI